MGWAVEPGSNVPAWLLDSQKLKELLDRLKGALDGPPSFSAGLDPSALAHDKGQIRDAISLVGDAARSVQVGVRQAFAEFRGLSVDPAHERRLTDLVNELTQLWSVRVTMALGMRRSRVLRRLLETSSANILGVIRRENDENAHSDVLRWLLDPREATVSAPVALRCLVSRFREPDRWRNAIREGVELGCVSVRREVVIGYDMEQDDNRDRIDLVISGPGFVIGIENKVWAVEHDSQTRSYARWLRSLRVPLRGGLFLSPSGMPAASPSFQSLSYLELVACLLEAPAAGELPPREEHVLAGYLKTLQRRILRAEFNAILEDGGIR
jgi:hypothetical protein